jgi:pimeloyl-ACP methyl ester carboxylesterase
MPEKPLNEPTLRGLGNGCDTVGMADHGTAPGATHEMTTPDGRVVRYCVYGPADGPPLIFHQGTPGSRRRSPKGVEAIERAGVRLLAPDRPGYGGSTRQPGRTVADVVADVELLADAQGWDEFAVVGASGGGPHALACAALLPARVTRAAAVVSPAPYDADGLDWLDRMSPGNVEEFALAVRGEEAFRPLVRRIGADALAAMERGEPPVTSDYELSESDLAQLRARLAEDDPERLDRARATWVGGIDGWIDDGIAMTRPWGFDPAAITVPVSVWYGPEDVLVPPAHSEWLLGRIPGAERRLLDGGHMIDDDTTVRLLRWATATE